MKQIQTEVLVVGGGATGCGVVRDLAQRGFQAVLVEKGDLSHGTSGRYHGLLHSGARYAVSDPETAGECIQENRILRKILPTCIEDTGGLFVLSPHDDPDYAAQFIAGCHKNGIPVEEISISKMLRQEPALNPRITRCFRVPDASADSFLAADLNAEDARLNGARILRYHQVRNLILEKAQVKGVHCWNLVDGEEIQIGADLVINAGGPWAGKIAAMAGVVVDIVLGKGTMLALNHRIVKAVINRCKHPGDGDIIVPAHTVAVIGTTNVQVADADNFSIEPWEVDLLLTEGEKVIPGFSQMRILRSWAGVRPLYRNTSIHDALTSSRSYVLLDHETDSGIAGMITITGGKWTTYRKMAEAAVDLACQKLGAKRYCRTHLETLPAPNDLVKKSYYQPLSQSHKLARIEQEKSYGSLVCECELATEAEIVTAIIENGAQTIDDIRRDVRLGMGPCQGSFCTYRGVGLLHRLRKMDVCRTNLALNDFLQERWKGLRPILWGQQLRQERFTELIYLNNLNCEHLPGPQTGSLSPKMYLAPSKPTDQAYRTNPYSHTASKEMETSPRAADTINPEIIIDVLVVGAGLAGLSAALAAARRGCKVRVISEGWGSLSWLSGCIDVYGYSPSSRCGPVVAPAEGLQELFNDQPNHPYTRIGLEPLLQALMELQETCAAADYPLIGSLQENWLLPSGTGAMRPTCLAPLTMVAGDLRSREPTLIVGIPGYADFYPEWIADNLTTQGIPSQAVLVNIPEIDQRRFIYGRTLADLLEEPGFLEVFAVQLKSAIGKVRNCRIERVGVPAVLGFQSAHHIHESLQESIDLPLFEIPSLPPSVPGIRLQQIMVRAIEKLGGEVFIGMKAAHAELSNHSPQIIWSEAAARQIPHYAHNCILATGGFLGGGLITAADGRVEDPNFNFPIDLLKSRSEWFETNFFATKGHEIFKTGVRTDDCFHPIDCTGKCISENLYVVGGLLEGCDPIHTRSIEGTTLLSGWYIGNRM